MRRRRLSRRTLRRGKRVCDGARHDISPSLLFLWRRQAVRAQVVERGNRGMPPGFVPHTITGCRGHLPCEEQAAIEIEVGAVRIRIMGTGDRRALSEVLAAVETVGR